MRKHFIKINKIIKTPLFKLITIVFMYQVASNDYNYLTLNILLIYYIQLFNSISHNKI